MSAIDKDAALLREAQEIASTAEKDEDYTEFVDKFIPKLTTDDCYTPLEVYKAVKEWAVKEYGWHGREIVRPFWPGGNFESFDYPENCVVIDNPPFSIFSKIVNWYNEHSVDYFLFAPTKTMFNANATSNICVGVAVTYENGAIVNTSFVSSCGPRIRSAPELYRILYEVDRRTKEGTKKHLPRYSYPAPVITASAVELMSKYGIDYAEDRCEKTRALDEQRKAKKAIFGCGFLVPAAKAAAAKAAAAKAAAAKEWHLSPREAMIVSRLEHEQESEGLA